MIPFLKTYPTNLATSAKTPPDFEGTLVRLSPTSDELIAKQLKDTERIEKEQELVRKQLALPPDQRNHELLAKYKLSGDGAVLDGYHPDNDSRGVPLYYHYRCYFPQDDKIPFEHRPPNNYSLEIGNIYSTRGDKFTFYFPMATANMGGGIAFKLDRFNTYLDESGKWIPSEGVFDLFPALLLYERKDKTRANEIVEVFNRYGILKSLSTGGELYSSKIQLDFRIKNQDISVTAIPTTQRVEQVSESGKNLAELQQQIVINEITRAENALLSKDLKFMDWKDGELVETELSGYKLDKVYSNSVGILKRYRVVSGFDKYIILNGTAPGVGYARLEDAIAKSNGSYLDSTDKDPRAANKFKITNDTINKVIASKSQK